MTVIDTLLRSETKFSSASCFIDPSRDRELKGARPNIVWPRPDDVAKMIDRQLEQAVKIRLEEAVPLPKRPTIEYVTER